MSLSVFVANARNSRPFVTRVRLRFRLPQSRECAVSVLSCVHLTFLASGSVV
jgi:hypothetical protein